MFLIKFTDKDGLHQEEVRTKKRTKHRLQCIISSGQASFVEVFECVAIVYAQPAYHHQDRTDLRG